ncbi:hypothetical protein [Clostridium novyi]|uniref:hypothetical protein n=1 Tax=Clostridium novyi TaxID=1542 RepID=UPI0004D40CC6|nr:hypothetical protein [Clostridium novyi]KEH84720.1 hypothetical protein Z965_p0024 [Clostridium novyi A str. BKT29909]
MAWALAALVVIAGIIIFIEALVLLIAKEKTKEDVKKLDRSDLIELNKKGDKND